MVLPALVADCAAHLPLGPLGTDEPGLGPPFGAEGLTLHLAGLRRMGDMAAARAAAALHAGRFAAVAATMLDLGGLAAAVTAAMAAFFGRDGPGKGERGGAGEKDEAAHDKTPWVRERNGWLPALVPPAEERFGLFPRSDRPAKLNLAFQQVNAG
jgi:hypothetical protein